MLAEVVKLIKILRQTLAGILIKYFLEVFIAFCIASGTLLWDNAKIHEKLKLQNGETFRNIVFQYDTKNMEITNYLKEKCDEGVYIGYFAPINNGSYYWIFLLTNYNILTQETQAVVNNPELFLKTQPAHYKSIAENLIISAKLNLENPVLSQKDYNNIYQKEYTQYDIDANSAIIFRHFKERSSILLTQDHIDNGTFIKGIVSSLQLSKYGIIDDKVIIYVYKLDSLHKDHLHFISILFTEAKNKCNTERGRNNLGKEIYNIIKSNS